ncbi:MAG: urease accessory protein UreF [Pseudomonadota bacterium]
MSAQSNLQDLIRLQTWLSPAFPTGGFSYSHGLEAAIASGLISGNDNLKEWFEDLINSGPGWNDAVLLAESWRVAKDGKPLDGVCELATAIAFSKERYMEATDQGRAFLLAAKAWGGVPSLPDACALPIAVGAVAGVQRVDLQQTLTAYLHAYMSNQIQAALRLMKLGQQGGVELLASLENIIIETAGRAAVSNLDDLGSNTFLADISAMQHETMQSRIFRS